MDIVTLLLVGIFGSAFLVFYSYLLGLFLLPLVVLLLCAVLIICYEGLGALIEANLLGWNISVIFWVTSSRLGFSQKPKSTSA